MNKFEQILKILEAYDYTIEDRKVFDKELSASGEDAPDLTDLKFITIKPFYGGYNIEYEAHNGNARELKIRIPIK
jgi:hypothetical protein